MPSLAMALQPATSEKPEERKTNAIKDLREVLSDLVASRMANKMRKQSNLTRSVSMNDARKLSNAPEPAEHPVKVQDVNPPKPLDLLSSAPMGQTLQEKGKVDDAATIWQRMQSSSSGLSSETTPESDKENRDSIKKDNEDEDEDEEKTLRRIAQKRALRQKLKRQESLSKEGLEYLQQADARIALQQKQDIVKSRPPLAPISKEAMQAPQNRSAFARVTSLDFEAGRDRSKAVERVAMIDVANSLRDRIRQHNKSRFATKKQSHSLDRTRSSLPSKTKNQFSHGSLLQARPFKPTNSMPTLMRSVSDGGKENVQDGKISSRETSASLGSSEDWTDKWTYEAKRKAGLEGEEVALGHDDSGFFGSDEGADKSGDLSTKRRKLMEKSTNSTRSPFKTIQPMRQRATSAGNHSQILSPTKRGDDRDRLAAETLLAFGTHS